MVIVIQCTETIRYLWNHYFSINVHDVVIATLLNPQLGGCKGLQPQALRAFEVIQRFAYGLQCALHKSVQLAS
jgi:hypothetical protein